MIFIDDEYRVNADETCYSLQRKSVPEGNGRKRSENTKDKDLWLTRGYYSSMGACLKAYIRAKTRKYVSSPNINKFTEYFEYVEKIYNELKERFGEF